MINFPITAPRIAFVLRLFYGKVFLKYALRLQCILVIIEIGFLSSTEVLRMDHSLYGYLSRQTTQVLAHLLSEYLQKPDCETHRDVIEILQSILLERKNCDRPCHTD